MSEPIHEKEKIIPKIENIRPFDRLVEVMRSLRAPDGGCPWDHQQTPDTLKKYLIEEAYEALEALDGGNPGEIREELGDLLFQIVFQCRIAEEQEMFSVDDVVESICAKMIGRHPHVFGLLQCENADDVLRQWEERKREEGKNRTSILEGIPKALPALLRAHRIQSRAARVGFDWDSVEGVEQKLEEELGEFKQALKSGNPMEQEREFGDLLFSLVNIARHSGINAEDALRKANRRFTERFTFIETRAREERKKLSETPLEQMDIWWEEAKQSIEENSRNKP